MAFFCTLLVYILKINNTMTIKIEAMEIKIRSKIFNFEPVLRGVFDEMRHRVALRLKNELGFDERGLIK